MIKDRCCRVSSPGKCLDMDESLVLFNGRLSFKQYISSKTARFGIKLYQLCTSNGILLDFLVYHGKSCTRFNNNGRWLTHHRENSCNTDSEAPTKGTPSIH